jgi:3-oxoacid CoA-transferase B subunit
MEDGWVINLGIGLPTLVANELTGRDVLVHAENGIIGVGPPPAEGEEDMDVVNPGKDFATVVPGGSFIDSIQSFTLMRGGRLDLGVVGAYQVSFGGDLANWRLPGRRLAGIGGAADLVTGALRVWVMTRYHGPDGQPKLMRHCTYPVTARARVSRLYTDQGIFTCGPDGAGLVEVAPGCDRQQLLADLAEGSKSPPAVESTAPPRQGRES